MDDHNDNTCQENSVHHQQYQHTLLVLTLSIAAKDKHHVVAADVARVYLNAKMDDFVLVKFKGRALDIMCKINPKYNNLICWKENGQNLMHLQLAKVLYECLKLVLLWYYYYYYYLK